MLEKYKSIFRCPICSNSVRVDMRNSSIVCTSDTSHKFRINKGIPVLTRHESLSKEKELVKTYYSTYGWEKNQHSDFYQNELIFDDTRFIGQEYIKRSISLEARHFPGGELFLDCGCGAISYPEYIEISKRYKSRVFLDISSRSLLQAKPKVNTPAIFVSADMVSLPFKNNTFNAILCSHALYHLPKSEQHKALLEFKRVLKPNGILLIIYDVQRNSLLRQLLSAVSHIVSKITHSPQLSSPSQNALYSYHFEEDWFRNDLFRTVSIYPHRVLTKQLSRKIPDNSIGLFCITVLLFMQEKLGLILFRNSPYISIVYKK